MRRSVNERAMANQRDTAAFKAVERVLSGAVSKVLSQLGSATSGSGSAPSRSGSGRSTSRSTSGSDRRARKRELPKDTSSSEDDFQTPPVASKKKSVT